jgi:predicted methyltransferase
LNELPFLELWLLDSSPAMHELARARLGDRVDRMHILRRSFTDPAWAKGLESFDAVISNQSVHELRHKRHAATLHAQVATILKTGAPYLLCDHFCGEGGMMDDRLYMTLEEQRQALVAAGFDSVVLVARSGSLVMYRAA